MRLSRTRKAVILLSALVVIRIIILVKRTGNTVIHGDKTYITHAEFLVDTPTCQIPKLDPFDISIREHIHTTKSITCQSKLPVTYEDGLFLRLNWTAINESSHNGQIKYCTYKPIYRPKYEPKSHNYWKYLDESEPFNDTVAIRDEFVRVSCYNRALEEVYFNVHAFIQPNKTVDEILKKRLQAHVKQDDVTEHTSVIMIAMDSVSRLGFHRKMTNTREFLLDSLGAMDMMEYNKVADNTLVNMIPLLVGKFNTELANSDHTYQRFDDVNFIWKQFSEKGYRTFFAEDHPTIGVFDYYTRRGFKTPPTDYFNRPLAMAMESMMNAWYNDNLCFQDRSETQIVLDYMYNFISVYRDDPYFAFAFLTRPTHDYLNGAGRVDELYYNLFRRLHDNDLLTNTVVLFFSDHGMRFGSIRNTYIGKLEERLPFMFVSVPKHWTQKYANITNNIRLNQHRLSTPFDVYETLQDMLYFNKVQRQTVKAASKHGGFSWLREIPINRSCKTSDIDPHWCTCARYEVISIAYKYVKHISHSIMSDISHKLSNFTDICENLTLLEIKDAFRLVTPDIQNKYEDIQVVIETTPGNALFESTFRIDSTMGKYTRVGDISRLNRYGLNASCMDNARLKLFCYCRPCLVGRGIPRS